MDSNGRLWYAAETAAGSGVYSLRQQNVSTWVQDTTTVSSTDITDMGSSNFSVYDDRVYYLDSSGNYVSRAIENVTDLRIEVSSTEHSFVNTPGQFAISEDGLFVADVPSAGVVRVINTETRQTNVFDVGSSVTIASLRFSADNQDLVYVDSVDGSIRQLGFEPGDQPTFSIDQKLHVASGSNGFARVSVDGSSHRGRFRLQHGPDNGQELFFETGDVRLNTLKLSRTSLASVSHADDALKRLDVAITQVALQRSKMGAQESRIMQTYAAMQHYTDSISQADSVLRDVDMAREAANMAESQVRYQAATALLAQANQSSATVLQLLRG